MIQLRTRLSILDNYGAKLGRCIRVNSKTQPGTIVLLSLRKLKKIKARADKAQLKRGDLYKALILITTRPLARIDGTSLRFQHNGAILLTSNEKILGTRFKFALPYEVRKKKWAKLVSLTPSLV